MIRHGFILLLGLYVSLDLANPFMPGAFNFNPADSVDGVRPQYEVFRSRLAAIATPPSIRDTALNRAVITPQRAEPAELPAVGVWRVDLRQRQSSSSEPLPTEDH
jgi:hypothetical protein